MFAALAAAADVVFVPWAAHAARPDGVVAIAKDVNATLPETAGSPPPPMLVMADAAAGGGPSEKVRLADHETVDARIRGVLLRDTLSGQLLTPAASHERILAGAPSGAVWTRSVGPAPLYRVRAILPELPPDQALIGFFWDRNLAAVALIQFLRSLRRADGWRPPPIRAAFVFDDPNLRWRSYGFIDYRRLVAHADAHDYHAAMAMIPLDAGRAHGPTAALFARRRDRLSLVVHGNDHIKRELFRPREQISATAIAAQAIRRMERFERRWNVSVDRIMTPPHGMCSKTVARALAAVGFDALCAIHPIPWAGGLPPSPPLAGWNPAQFVGGCAVLPRISLSTSTAEIALRAFLDHPVVLYAHHEDLADGFEPLADAALRVNGLGEVRWMSLGEIAGTNYSAREADGVLAVRPYSRRLTLELHEVSGLTVEAPEPAHGRLELTGWTLGAGPVHPFGATVPLPVGARVEVRLRGPADVHPADVGAPAWTPWPLLRRMGTETRDRALPFRPGRIGRARRVVGTTRLRASVR